MILINGKEFNSSEFHNGEVIFKKTPIINQDNNVIEMKFQDNRDITALLFARQWLTDVALGATCDLVMQYCPYERMDREINDQLFSMKYFADILSKFDFNRVYILDPHSEVCINQLGDAGIKIMQNSLVHYIKEVVEDFKPDYICYPDKGAYNKYPKILSDVKLESFYGSKKRDLENNGKIVEYELVNAPDLKDKKVLIIDDICCLGGTAYNAAKEMKKLGAKEVAFYISHCENGIYAGNVLKLEPYELDFSEGNTLRTANLKSHYMIDKVYTANTMNIDIKHENIKVVN